MKTVKKKKADPRIEVGPSYREQINADLTKLAEKWKTKGMPGLAAVLVLVADFYSKEMEGYLLSMLASVHRLMSRIQGELGFVESNAERTPRTRPARRRH